MIFRSIGIIGAGNIGTGVATDLILHGIPTLLIDNSADAINKGRREILKNVRFAPILSKLLPKISQQEACERLTFSPTLTDVAECDFVIENVTEDWDVKRRLYGELDQLLPAHICIGANTSCISITQLASVTKRAKNIVGVHFMNPVHLKQTVEVIRGFHTSPETLNRLSQLFTLLNKEAIVVEDLPGFVSNRISHLFMNEAAFVLQDQVSTAENIDAIFKKCFGHKMGPLETADLIGLDTVMHSLDVLYESFQDSKYRCCPLLRKLVYAGHLGRKTGRGFYSYPAE